MDHAGRWLGTTRINAWQFQFDAELELEIILPFFI
jgi:hypothetical protein